MGYQFTGSALPEIMCAQCRKAVDAWAYTVDACTREVCVKATCHGQETTCAVPLAVFDSGATIREAWAFGEPQLEPPKHLLESPT